MKVQVLSGAIPETFNFLFQDVATNITVGGETPTFQRNPYCDAACVSQGRLS